MLMFLSEPPWEIIRYRLLTCNAEKLMGEYVKVEGKLDISVTPFLFIGESFNVQSRLTLAYAMRTT